MKQLLLLILLIPAATSGQSNPTLDGRWTGDWTQTYERSSPGDKEKFEACDDETKHHIRSGIETRQFTINKDGSFQLTWTNTAKTRKVSGYWSWNLATNDLTLTATTSSTMRYHITFLDQNTMLLKVLEGSNSLLFNGTVMSRD